MAAFNITVSGNTQNFNLNTALIAAGWNGTDVVEATITVNAGVYVWSDSTASAGMSITTLPANSTVALINNGFIIGKGGNGGPSFGIASTADGRAGLPGGPAISLANNITITNNSYIAGGGGGGAGGYDDGGGGGAGGGTGGAGKQGFSAFATVAGGAGGSIGQSGSNGAAQTNTGQNEQYGGGGGGGRVLPGTGAPIAFYNSGTDSAGRGGQAGGGGGAAHRSGGDTGASLIGGPGGARNLPGTSMKSYSDTFYTLRQACGGGGWGAAGGSAWNYSADTVNTVGGAGGKSIALNGYTVTFITAGIIYGEFS
jgi:hypothetical protein